MNKGTSIYCLNKDKWMTMNKITSDYIYLKSLFRPTPTLFWDLL